MTQKRMLPSGANDSAAGESGMRPAVKWGAIAVLVFSIGGLIYHFHGPRAKRSIQNADPGASHAPAPKTVASKSIDNRPGTLPQLTTASVRTSPQADHQLIPAPPITLDPALSGLVAGLKQLSGTNAALSAEAIAAWRTNFMQLVQSGPSAVPALRAFLDQKTDYAFGREVWQALGYSSARVAAIDALRQIGGPEALAAMEGLLGSTQSPREIALLARNLEESSPGQFREQALTAARSGLQAALLSTDSQLDVAPLFEVFQHYGDASIIADLEKAMNQWKYYATITLANLPDGAGIPSILRMADASSGNRVVALEMVAQLAVDTGAAREFLLAQASGNKIPANLWPYLTGPLAGDQYFPVDSTITQYPQLQSWSDLKTTRINSGNQNLYMLPGYQSLTAEAINARVALVDELLRATTDPAAVAALERARETLARRSTRATSQAQTSAGTGAGTGQ